MVFTSGTFVTPVFADVDEGVRCIDGIIPGTGDGNFYDKGVIGCTANDVVLSSPVVTPFENDTCNFPGDILTLQILFDVTLNATQRNDISVWFSVDGDPNGDGPATGVDATSCTVASLPNDLELNTDGNNPTIPGNYDTDFDGDVCGDIANAGENNDKEFAIISPEVVMADLGTFDLICNDSDGDGFLDVPIIVAWSNDKTDNSCDTAAKDLVRWPRV